MELPPLLNPFRKLSDQSLCWCQSGRPYALCHKDRADQRRASPHEALNLLTRQFRQKIGCLHPDAPAGCAGKIIDSHTIQRSGPLRAISKNGEVYSMRGAANRLIENHGRLLPSRQGISTVSTFPGFCRQHDNEFFLPVENGIFDITPENMFLFHYRNICAELHAKSSMQFGDKILNAVDSGTGIMSQLEAQQFAADMNYGASLAESELKNERSRLNAMWKKGDFSSLSGFYIEFEGQLPFAASFAATPKFSINASFIQDWSEDTLKGLSCSPVYIDGKSGFLISSFHEELLSTVSTELADRNYGTPSNLLRWVVSNAENVGFNIDWWDHLASRRREHLLKLAMIGTGHYEDDEEIEIYKAAIEVLPRSNIVRSLHL
jgi:hypothetical protein